MIINKWLNRATITAILLVCTGCAADALPARQNPEPTISDRLPISDFVIIGYDVDATGHVQNIHVIHAPHSAQMARDFEQQIKHRRFSPGHPKNSQAATMILRPNGQTVYR